MVNDGPVDGAVGRSRRPPRRRPGLRPGILLHCQMTSIDLARYIRDVPDFPVPGILFRDITPLLRDQRVLVVDDVIATGGTAAAVVELVEKLGGTVVGVQFLVELAGLHGRDLLEGREVRSVLVL